MKQTNYFILAAMSSGYLGSFLSGLLHAGSWTLIVWGVSLSLVFVSVAELSKSREHVARAMVGSWAMALVAGTTAHVSITWSVVMFLPVLVIMGAWAWYIRRGIKKTLISH